MIPGAQIPGNKYIPLAEEIQRQMADRAKVWVGITKVKDSSMKEVLLMKRYFSPGLEIFPIL